MKLNPDCIRDIMLYLETNITYIGEHKPYEHSEIPLSKIITDLNQYSSDDVTYSIEKLIEAQYIEINSIIRGKSNKIIKFNISSITYNGHQFLDDIRPKKFWEIAKSRFKSAAIPSIEILAKGAKYAANLYITEPEKFKKTFDDIANLIT